MCKETAIKHSKTEENEVISLMNASNWEAELLKSNYIISGLLRNQYERSTCACIQNGSKSTHLKV